MATKSSLDKVKSFTTRDGSAIRELLHPESSAASNQSLAQATVLPGDTTHLHKHAQTEEIYHITQGCGAMQLAQEQFEVVAGDSVLIPPGTPHCITNTGTTPLQFLCMCSPAYSHADTELLD